MAGQTDMGPSAAEGIGANNGTQGILSGSARGLEGISFQQQSAILDVMPMLGVVGKLFKGMEGMAGAMSASNVALGSVVSPPVTPTSGPIAGLVSAKRGK